MKSIIRYILAAMCVVALVSNIVTAQELQKMMQQAGRQYAENYAKPILTGFAASFNSAFYHSADLHDFLGFDVGVKFGLSKVDDVDKTYKFTLPVLSGNLKYKDESGANIDGGTVVNAPTAVGEKGRDGDNFYQLKTASGKKIFLPDGTTPVFVPGGYDLSLVPMPMPQVAIGLPFGLEVIGRYLPTVDAKPYGKINYMGFGLRYDIDQWLPMFPIDIALHFVSQKMNFKSMDDKDIFSANGTAYGLELSKRLLFITLYGGYQIEKATVEVNADPNGLYPAMKADDPNKSRLIVGVRLLLLIINVHAEYSIAKTPVLAAGIGISLR